MKAKIRSDLEPEEDRRDVVDAILKLQRDFETHCAEKLGKWVGDQSAIPEAKELIEEIGCLEIKFDIPQQAQWLAVLTLLFTPLMIGLVGLI